MRSTKSSRTSCCHCLYNQDEHSIGIGLDLKDDALTITVEDDGRPFDPLSVAPPDLDLNAESRDVGGLGLHIVRSIMDGVESSAMAI